MSLDFGDPQTIAAADGAALEAAVRDVPDHAAVFLVHAAEGRPYFGKTAHLRRRLLRLLREPEQFSKRLNLRAVARRVEYWLTASRLETDLVSYAAARKHFAEDYAAVLRLRMPAYLKVIGSNPFPRTTVTRRLAGSLATFYGPFRNRASAERFQGEFLDLFQLRRCPEDLEPSPAHPGCVYGEMNLCLRPCQQVVSLEEYASEVSRARDFLATQGATLLRTLEAARDQLSEEARFEDAARMHKRLERVRQVLRLRDELCHTLNGQNGVVIARPATPGMVNLFFLIRGWWQRPLSFDLRAAEETALSMDRRLLETTAKMDAGYGSARERQEHLAMLARWYYSSWRDGEWLAFSDVKALPVRKLVNAIHRVAAAGHTEGTARKPQL